MAELLAEGYRRLFKGKRFYIVLTILCCLGLLYIALYRYAEKIIGDGMGLDADFLLFSNLGIMPLFIAIAGGMLIRADFANNTIRNKIIIGHSRLNIYLANWIVTASIALIYEAVFALLVLAIGIPVLGAGTIPSKEITYNFLITIPLLLAFVSIIVFLCSVLRNLAGSIISIAMHYIAEMIAIPLFYIKNEDLRQFIYEAVPSLQMSIIQQGFDQIPDHAVLLPTYSIIISIIFTIAGIYLFNKADLK